MAHEHCIWKWFLTDDFPFLQLMLKSSSITCRGIFLLLLLASHLPPLKLFPLLSFPPWVIRVPRWPHMFLQPLPHSIIMQATFLWKVSLQMFLTLGVSAMVLCSVLLPPPLHCHRPPPCPQQSELFSKYPVKGIKGYQTGEGIIFCTGFLMLMMIIKYWERRLNLFSLWHLEQHLA